MTTLRKAAKKALEALEAHADIGIKSDKAIFALREALAQPEREPVAWAVYDIKHGGSKTLHWPEQHSPNGDPSQFKAVPLYSVPPQRKPLTDEEILKIWNDMGNDPIAPSIFSFIACVRKTEQAHGIVGEQ